MIMFLRNVYLFIAQSLHCIALYFLPPQLKLQRINYKIKHLNIIFLRNIIAIYRVATDICMDFM